MLIYGIDVSSHQTGLPIAGTWDFLIVKATEGHTYKSPAYAAQLAAGRSASAVIGHYHFLWPGSIAQQGAYFLDNIDLRAGEFLALDWEETTEETAATSEEKDALLEYLGEHAPGHRHVLYTNRDFWRHRDKSGRAGDGLWIADPSNPAGSPDVKAAWIFHQFSTAAHLDRNCYRGTREQLAEWAATAPTGKPKPAPHPPAKPAVRSYMVKAGDTLSEIAAAHDVRLAELERANPQIKDPNLIYPGQKITIPGGKTPAPAPKKKTYTVKFGDTLSEIAAAHDVKLAALERANPQIKDPNLIYPGQKITIP